MTSYAGREINVFPPRSLRFRKTYPDLLPVHPTSVGFAVEGVSDIAVSGAEYTASIQALELQLHDVDEDHVQLIARWSLADAAQKRDFGLFVSGALIGVAASAFIEALRNVVEICLSATRAMSRSGP